jgi:tRNA-specific 2-thiouridylase
VRVLVAMSGGVDSSLAAALLVEQGHDVVGATLKLWGGPSDSGCCSVADVEDARRVAQRLGIVHHVFNLTGDFAASVVEPYVDAHRRGRTPNPCIECNRHIKFDRLLRRATRLGHDALATGHHARISADGAGRRRLLRGVDGPKDQSYVLSMLGQAQLVALVLPIGELTKSEVRARAAALGLGTAAKPDSQDVCFIHGAQGREGFLSERLALHRADVVDAATGERVGDVEAVELVTVGQRRGMGHGSDGRRRYVVDVDVTGRRVVVGPGDEVRSTGVMLEPGSVTWVDGPLADGQRAIAQLSAHGRPVGCTVGYVGAVPGDPGSPGGAGGASGAGGPGGASGAGGAGATVHFDEPQRPVAPGQTVALYDADEPAAVVGAGIVAAAHGR